jgi:hypothetical protein
LVYRRGSVLGVCPARKTARRGRTPVGGLAYWRRANFAFRLNGQRGHSRHCEPTPNRPPPTLNVTSSPRASHSPRGGARTLMLRSRKPHSAGDQR